MQCRRRPGVDHRIAFCIGRSFICLRSRIRALSARITKAGTRKTNSSCKSANPLVAMLSYHAKPIFHGLHISNNNETRLHGLATATWECGNSIYIQKAPTVGSGPMGRLRRDSNSRRELPSHAFEACSLDRSDTQPWSLPDTAEQQLFYYATESLPGKRRGAVNGRYKTAQCVIVYGGHG